MSTRHYNWEFPSNSTTLCLEWHCLWHLYVAITPFRKHNSKEFLPTGNIFLRRKNTYNQISNVALACCLQAKWSGSFTVSQFTQRELFLREWQWEPKWISCTHRISDSNQAHNLSLKQSVPFLTCQCLIIFLCCVAMLSYKSWIQSVFPISLCNQTQWATFVSWANRGLLVFSSQKQCQCILAAGLPLTHTMTVCYLGPVNDSYAGKCAGVLEMIHLRCLVFIIMTGLCVWCAGLSLELALLKMTTRWNNDIRGQSKRGRQGWQRKNESRKAERGVCKKHTYKHMQSDSVV